MTNGTLLSTKPRPIFGLSGFSSLRPASTTWMPLTAYVVAVGVILSVVLFV